MFSQNTHSHPHTVRAEKCYSLWCRPGWHVKVNTRIVNYTLFSSFWVLPVTCLFASFNPLPVRTHTITRFPAQTWQNMFACMWVSQGSYPNIALSKTIYTIPLEWITVTGASFAFDTNIPPSICSISKKTPVCEPAKSFFEMYILASA